MSYKNRIESIVKELNQGVYEKDQAINLVLLSFLSGKSAFLYGPPGTAKSLIARRVALAFDMGEKADSNTFFAYLMNRFSTPEEIFGPIDIAELKKNRLTRSTQGYLPTAHFAFLDEIWKSSPAILNTLLTIINEKIYRDGNTDIKVPLKGLVCASNEFPMQNQGLEALYDRLVIRLSVLPIEQKSSFEALLDEDIIEPKVTNPITLDELQDITQKAKKIKFSHEAKEAMHFLKASIESYNKSLRLRNLAQDNTESSQTESRQDTKNQSIESIQEPISHNGIYVSDRRWRAMAELLKTAAVLSDRDEVQPIDIMLLAHCLWSDEAQKEVVNKLIVKALQSSMQNAKFDISSLKEEYSKHYDATIAECYEQRKPKHVNQTTKNLYMQACDGIIENINNYQTKLQEIFLSTQNEIANPFLSTSDYRNALRGITQTQTELKQLSLAADQLRYIIQNQPTPIPLKYGEKKQQQNKHQPQTKEELKKLVEDESIHLGDIDTSGITDMSCLFKDSNRTDFSGIESWDVSNVKNMTAMFGNARSFNQPLNDWDVSNVTNMAAMFFSADSFNQPLNSWDVSNVESMEGMFFSADSFNQPLNSWDVSNVENMEDMFDNTSMRSYPEWYE
ncbi:BspA family leucine-rich repeat surface protein [Helicobacter bilis]|uniref:BspA family leucine-rich repeat surface protein n=1 Tax=Helicobacter bilis TaxID=37372 RepID=UPI0026EE3C89|nr:BspA family leucine-rich repeat surface protein [Helicobacter bilis]MCI7410206.1 BspA family leucine-rich repeat surface protein [Helicobacter bilis]MDD7297645.1 BspA family leucine-rich repeat surface protein [Helicobacter bilis]MDY4400786.1 BspA family leucine-rich repeat surface protein [Helicobacter bilis]